ncbi:hypothetical protein [Bacillus sp. FJAT-50079]|uniref:hypothetical protein n=1 Tax=Bacillus sp. FJAT-50079 TaxID=2833577 RepID=UPI001BC9AE95|nr:hypothetical protein [Bacillus sp. FJAT-50079]MBS4208491.1 hypothetical protein [Bacillus sp. FJAT-50079]
MKKPFVSMILSLLSILIIGWVLISLYDMLSQFAHILKNPEPPWEINFYFLPLLLLLVFTLILSFFYFGKRKHKDKRSLWLYPFEFTEEDEREQQISGEACRKAFIATWISASIAATLFVFFPLFQNQFIHFPIYLILFIPVVQIITYYIHIRKI